LSKKKIIRLEETINSDYNNIAGIVVLKNGKILYENYFNECTGTDAIHVFSVTKSIISILIGIAIDKGYIKSIKQNVLYFFLIILLREAKKQYKTLRLNIY
jgi:hypothetical protein